MKTIRGRETTCDKELKDTTTKCIKPEIEFKKKKIDSSTYSRERERERERIIIFFQERM